jgi:hypothetical protein
MGVQEAGDPELNELAKDVRPEEVLDKMEESDNGAKASQAARRGRP